MNKRPAVMAGAHAHSLAETQSASGVTGNLCKGSASKGPLTRAECKSIYRMADNPADIKVLAGADLFFLLVYVMGRGDMDNDWCFERCREVQRAPDGYLDLWAREHYKSTIITIGLTIQDVLNNPDITVGIFSHTRAIAKSFLRQIKREFESNLLLQELFPHITPPSRREARNWSEEGGLVVSRVSNPKEATIEAWGLVDGQPTGKHFDLMVYDDVVTRESVYTPEQIKKTTEAWELSLNLGAHGGVRRIIGTRYHFNDTYRDIIERGSALPRIYAATANGQTEGAPVLFSKKELAAKRRDMGPYTFGCQMLLNPVADKTQAFHKKWLNFYKPLPVLDGDRENAQADGRGNMRCYLLVDPAGEKKKNSDYTVMWVIGIGVDGMYYVIDGLRDRLNLTERTRALFRLCRKHQPLAVGYERYGMQADIEHIKYMQTRENFRFHIYELGGPMPKNDRIRRLIPLFEGGRFFLPEHCYFIDSKGRMRDMTREFIDDEYHAFPVAIHDDMLDCMARIIDISELMPKPLHINPDILKKKATPALRR